MLTRARRSSGSWRGEYSATRQGCPSPCGGVATARPPMRIFISFGHPTTSRDDLASLTQLLCSARPRYWTAVSPATGVSEADEVGRSAHELPHAAVVPASTVAVLLRDLVFEHVKRPLHHRPMIGSSPPKQPPSPTRPCRANRQGRVHFGVGVSRTAVHPTKQKGRPGVSTPTTLRFSVDFPAPERGETHAGSRGFSGQAQVQRPLPDRRPGKWAVETVQRAVHRLPRVGQEPAFSLIPIFSQFRAALRYRSFPARLSCSTTSPTVSSDGGL